MSDELRPRKMTKDVATAVAVKPPSTTTNGLTYRFQVFFRDITSTAQLRVVGAADPISFPTMGPLQSIEVVAETPGEAEWTIRKDPSVKVFTVGPGIPVPSDANREVFDRQAGAAFLGVEVGLIDKWMEKGLLPVAKGDGHPRFTRGQLIKAAVAHMAGGGK